MVVVTGSLLPQRGAESNPIVVVSAGDIERSAALTLEVALNQLPQVTPSYSASANNPSANGAAYVDLRGLGRGRNLVLLDGRRMVGGNASNSVDLNTIPLALIERVEVLSGGAAAIYGADAVAGAVNVVLKDDFDGTVFEARTLVGEHSDGRQHNLSLTTGLALPAGSIVGYLGWSERDEIGKGDRPFSSQASVGSSFFPAGAYVTGPNLPTQAAVDQVFGRYGVAAGAVPTRGGAFGFGFNSDGTIFSTGVLGSPIDAQNVRTPRNEQARSLFPDVYAYNFEPFNKLVLPLERTSAALLADYDVNDALAVYGRAFWTRYTAATALAPAPAPTDPNPLYPGLQVPAFTIPVTNPFIPSDLRVLLASRTGNSPALAGAGPNEEFQYRFRASELGGRGSFNEADMLQLHTGLEADLPSGWNVEAHLGWGSYRRDDRREGLLSVRRFEQLLDSPGGGTEFCAGGLNPFGAGINPACRDFLSVPATYWTRVEMGTATVLVEPPSIRLPAGDLQIITGLERRSVDFRFEPPQGLTTGEVAGFIPQGALQGEIQTTDLFAEATAPLSEDGSMLGRWQATLGYRASIEDGAEAAHSAKAEANWTPVPGLIFRSSLQRAIRAPDIFERFQPSTAGSSPVIDPCTSSLARSAGVLALCRAQGLALGFPASYVDAFVQPIPEIALANAGTPGLEAEAASTLTVGGVWRPASGNAWLQDVGLSVDWYRISIDNAIGYTDPQLQVNGCYETGTNPTLDAASPACRTFMRSSVDFALASIASPRSNQAYVETSGVDLSASFATDLAAVSGQPFLGELRTHAAFSWLDRFEEQTSPLQRRIDFAGTIGGGFQAYTSLPRWRGQMGVNWSSGPLAIGLAGRYIGAMEHRQKRIDPASPATGPGETTYWDLDVSWEFDELVQLRLGVLNLFDRGPELFTPPTDANTDPSTYDVVGRRFWIAFTLRS